MNKTSISIGRTNYPDGTKKIKARIKELGTTKSDNVLNFEKQFNKLREKLKKQIKKTDKKTGDALNHWILGDMVIEFEEYADKQGFLYDDNTKPLVQYVGKSVAYWMLHKRFRRVYLSKESVNPNIPFKMYLPMIRETNDKNRKIFEENILNGTITNQQVIWGLLKIPTVELQEKMKEITNNVRKKSNKKMLPSHIKILDALKKKDMDQYELAEYTGLSHDSVRGRKTELVHRFGCNIKVVDGRYHLDDND